MITYEQGLEEKIEDLETHVEALECELEELSCHKDSYESICVNMFEEMVILKSVEVTIGMPKESKIMKFLDKYIKILDENLLPEEDDDDE